MVPTFEAADPTCSTAKRGRQHATTLDCSGAGGDGGRCLVCLVYPPGQLGI